MVIRRPSFFMTLDDNPRTTKRSLQLGKAVIIFNFLVDMSPCVCTVLCNTLEKAQTRAIPNSYRPKQDP